MKFQLILIFLLDFFSFSIQGRSNDCIDIEGPSSKEECTAINMPNLECCYVKITEGSETYLTCWDYNPDNYELLKERELKTCRYENIAGYLANHDDIDSLDDDTIINELKENSKLSYVVECKDITFSIDFSTIEYSKEDIEIAKQENFFGNIDYKEVTESICLNGIIFSDLKAAGEKSCYVEVNYMKGDDPISSKECYSLSQAERENFGFLEYILFEYANKPFTATVRCDGFNYEYDSSTGKWNEISPYQPKCEDITDPSSKEQCNNFNLLNSECCYVKETYESEEYKTCVEYSPEEINYDNYVKDELKNIKNNLISSYLLENTDQTITYEKITEDLKQYINMLGSQNIECKTFSKTIDYSTITYSEDDIEIARKDNFCVKLSFDRNKLIEEEQCLNGVVFSELEKTGEKCCYAEIYLEESKKTYTYCLSLSVSQRENDKYLLSLVDMEKISEPSTVKFACNGITKQYKYINNQWTKISPTGSSSTTPTPSSTTSSSSGSIPIPSSSSSKTSTASSPISSSSGSASTPSSSSSKTPTPSSISSSSGSTQVASSSSSKTPNPSPSRGSTQVPSPSTPTNSTPSSSSATINNYNIILLLLSLIVLN